MNKKKLNIATKIALTYLVFVGLLAFFRSGMSGVFSIYYSASGIEEHNISFIKSFQNIGILMGLIPAGILADKIGRLKVLTLSSWIMAISFGIILTSSTLVSFSIAEWLYGVGLALNSGILLAYVSDLQEEKGVVISNQTMGRRTTVLNAATLLGGNIGTSLFNVNIDFPLYFSIIGLSIYPFIIFFWLKISGFKDNKSEILSIEKTSEKKLKKILALSNLRNFKINRPLLNISIANLIFEAAIQFVLIYWSIYYVQQLGFNLTLVFTLMMSAVILGSELYVKIINYLENSTVLLSSILVMGISLVGIGMIDYKMFSLILFILFEIGTGIFTSSVHAEQNKALISQNNKSKVLSLIDFTTEISVIFVLMINNYFIESLGVQKMFIASGMLLGLVLLVVLKNQSIKERIS